jgi:DNA transposition AAA+ family ATPase
MNVDKGKESFTEEEIADLRTRLLAYKAEHSLSWKELGKRVEIPDGTISVWAGGKYAGDNAAVAYKVNRFFLAEVEREELEMQAPLVPPFQLTRTAREIMSQCRWAHRGKFVVAVGVSGVGKTGALRQYAATTPNAHMSTMHRGSRSPSTMLLEILKCMRVNTRSALTIQSLTDTIADRIGGVPTVLVVDEAQHLQDDSLEQLRYLHDMTGVGLLLSGNPEVLTRIGTRKAGFAQIHSRVSLPALYDKPYVEDVAVLCNAWGVTHPKEREFLAGIAERPGCLRNLSETLELATLTARAEEQDRTLDHMKAAWAQRQLRPIAA